MTAKEYLSQYHDMQTRIRRLTLEIERLETMLTSGAIRYDKDKVKTSPTNKREQVMADLADRKVELQSMREEAARIMCDVCDMIGRVQPEELALVLQLYYIEGLPMEEIAHRLHYNIRWTYQLKSDGLEKVNMLLTNSAC